MSPRATAAVAATVPTPVAPVTPEPIAVAPPLMLSGYRSLKVWQRAMDLAAAVHLLTKALPDSEEALRTELRRAAFTVPAEIAAGSSLFQRAEYVQHLSAALGAVARVECLLQTAERLGALPGQDLLPLLLLSIEVGRMLRGLVRSLQTKLDAELSETVN